MVKTCSSKPAKTEKSLSSSPPSGIQPGKKIVLELESDDDDIEIKEERFQTKETNIDEQDFNQNVDRTFIVVKQDPVIVVTFKLPSGEKSDAVLNIQVVGPTGHKRTLIVWGDHSYSVEKFFLCVAPIFA